MTAQELVESLKADEEFVRQAEIKEREHLERAAVLVAEQKDIVAELNSIGVGIVDLQELLYRRTSYEKAIPILVKHLKREYSKTTLAIIARCLAVPYARSVRAVIKEEYLKAEDKKSKFDSYKDGLAVALSASATDADFDEMVGLLQDTANGESRILMLRFLRKSKNPEAKSVIEKLSEDPELQYEIRSWGRKN